MKLCWLCAPRALSATAAICCLVIGTRLSTDGRSLRPTDLRLTLGTVELGERSDGTRFCKVPYTLENRSTGSVTIAQGALRGAVAVGLRLSRVGGEDAYHLRPAWPPPRPPKPTYKVLKPGERYESTDVVPLEGSGFHARGPSGYDPVAPAVRLPPGSQFAVDALVCIEVYPKDDGSGTPAELYVESWNVRWVSTVAE